MMTEPSQEVDGAEVAINVALPADLHRQLKVAAAMTGITLKAAVVAAIREWVDQ